MTSPPAQQRPAAFYGWRMVLVAFFVDFIAVGFFFYSYGVFFTEIAQEFGDSRLGVGLGLTTVQVSGGLLAPFIGQALDRFPLRRVIAIGSLSMGLGFLLVSQADNYWQFYLTLGLFIGFGAGAMGGLATAKLVSNWFESRRGTALGIAATGISASGVVMPAVTALIIENFGWRQGFVFYGVFTILIVVPVVLRLVISRPEDVGQRVDGHRAPISRPPPKPAAHGAPLTMSRSPAPRGPLVDPQFWSLTIGIGLLFCCMSATLTHMVPRLSDAGYALSEASLMLSLAAGFGIIGKLVVGWLADRWTGRNTFWLAAATQALGQIGMFYPDRPLVFALGAVLFGFGFGGVVPMQGALIGQLFGRERFGRVMGLMRPGMLPVQVIGVPAAGAVFDATGSYDLAFASSFVLYAIAALVVVPLRTGRGHRRPRPLRS
ncbi:MAG: MFS transporter [Pseudomonadota bacterium]